MGLTRAISPLSSIEAVSFDGQNSQRSPLPRIGVIYASNPYDRSMFGDRILGSVGAAYLICLELQREFPDCGLLAVPEFARDLSKVEIGDAIPSLSEEHYEYAISIEPDPNSRRSISKKRLLSCKRFSEKEKTFFQRGRFGELRFLRRLRSFFLRCLRALRFWLRFPIRRSRNSIGAIGSSPREELLCLLRSSISPTQKSGGSFSLSSRRIIRFRRSRFSRGISPRCCM